MEWMCGPAFSRKWAWIECIEFETELLWANDGVPVIVAQTDTVEQWNFTPIPRCSSNFHLLSYSFLDSCLLAGGVSRSWPLIWNSLAVTWAPKMYNLYAYWPYREYIGRCVSRDGKIWVHLNLTLILKVTVAAFPLSWSRMCSSASSTRITDSELWHESPALYRTTRKPRCTTLVLKRTKILKLWT